MGGIPSSVAPECPGDSKSRAGTPICISCCSACRFYELRDVCKIYFVSFERDAKLKGPRYLTGRASANCASGKYHGSPIKLESLDTNLARLVSSKVQAVEGLQDQYRQLNAVYDPNASVGGISIMHLGMGTNGSEVAQWQVPARPIVQRGLTYT